ncbi:MAG: DUF1566 domain-containing protein [Accumulibacter sp.]
MRMGTVRIFLLASVGSILFAICNPSHAALYNRGGGLIYDDVQNITWLQDANYGAGSSYDNGTVDYDGAMTWANAMAWADNLTYFDSLRNVTYSDWRLPQKLGADCIGWNCTHSEMGYLYYFEFGRRGGDPNIQPNPTPFLNVLNAAYWTSTLFWPPDPNDMRSWFFTMGTGGQGAWGQEHDLLVWAVRDGDVASASVPEPQSYRLILAGVLLLLGVRAFKQYA